MFIGHDDVIRTKRIRSYFFVDVRTDEEFSLAATMYHVEETNQIICTYDIMKPDVKCIWIEYRQFISRKIELRL